MLIIGDAASSHPARSAELTKRNRTPRYQNPNVISAATPPQTRRSGISATVDRCFPLIKPSMPVALKRGRTSRAETPTASRTKMNGATMRIRLAAWNPTRAAKTSNVRYADQVSALNRAGQKSS